MSPLYEKSAHFWYSLITFVWDTSTKILDNLMQNIFCFKYFFVKYTIDELKPRNKTCGFYPPVEREYCGRGILVDFWAEILEMVIAMWNIYLHWTNKTMSKRKGFLSQINFFLFYQIYTYFHLKMALSLLFIAFFDIYIVHRRNTFIYVLTSIWLTGSTTDWVKYYIPV